jgi:cholesterol oxidase
MIPQNYGRRRFLQNAALFSAGVIGSTASATLTRATTKGRDQFVNAVVIGSGFGGSVASLRLGQAGIDTVLLERGRRWTITSAQDTFATFRQPDRRAAWLSSTSFFEGTPIDVYTGVLEVKQENGITVVCGAGVGGSSLVYNCFHYQPSRDLFYRSFPRSIDYEEMDEIYYPRVRSIVSASTIPDDILASSYYASSRVFREQAAAAELPHRLIDIAVDWDIVRQEIAGTKVASAIIGEVTYGINSGAKNSVDRNYLVQAENTGFVEILPLHVATEITEVPGIGYRVTYNQINESGETIATNSITCRYLFLAAGSMGTSALLVKAKAKGMLPRLNNFVGKGWAGNGDTLATRSGLPTPTNPGQGGPGGAYVIEHLDNPFGPVSLELAPRGDLQEGSLPGFGVAQAYGTGSFTYNAVTDSVQLNWPARSGRRFLKAAEYTYSILDKANTTANFQPTSEVDASLTVHPLGGVVIGKACDLYGRVFGYRGLYVVDGALMPGYTGSANPAITIAAFAERNLDEILDKDIFTTRPPSRRYLWEFN